MDRFFNIGGPSSPETCCQTPCWSNQCCIRYPTAANTFCCDGNMPISYCCTKTTSGYAMCPYYNIDCCAEQSSKRRINYNNVLLAREQQQLLDIFPQPSQKNNLIGKYKPCKCKPKNVCKKQCKDLCPDKSSVTSKSSQNCWQKCQKKRKIRRPKRCSSECECEQGLEATETDDLLTKVETSEHDYQSKTEVENDESPDENEIDVDNLVEQDDGDGYELAQALLRKELHEYHKHELTDNQFCNDEPKIQPRCQLIEEATKEPRCELIYEPSNVNKCNSRHQPKQEPKDEPKCLRCRQQLKNDSNYEKKLENCICFFDILCTQLLRRQLSQPDSQWTSRQSSSYNRCNPGSNHSQPPIQCCCNLSNSSENYDLKRKPNNFMGSQYIANRDYSSRDRGSFQQQQSRSQFQEERESQFRQSQNSFEPSAPKRQYQQQSQYSFGLSCGCSCCTANGSSKSLHIPDRIRNQDARRNNPMSWSCGCGFQECCCKNKQQHDYFEQPQSYPVTGYQTCNENKAKQIDEKTKEAICEDCCYFRERITRDMNEKMDALKRQRSISQNRLPPPQFSHNTRSQSNGSGFNQTERPFNSFSRQQSASQLPLSTSTIKSKCCRSVEQRAKCGSAKYDEEGAESVRKFPNCCSQCGYNNGRVTGVEQSRSNYTDHNRGNDANNSCYNGLGENLKQPSATRFCSKCCKDANTGNGGQRPPTCSNPLKEQDSLIYKYKDTTCFLGYEPDEKVYKIRRISSNKKCMQGNETDGNVQRQRYSDPDCMFDEANESTLRKMAGRRCLCRQRCDDEKYIQSLKVLERKNGLNQCPRY